MVNQNAVSLKDNTKDFNHIALCDLKSTRIDLYVDGVYRLTTNYNRTNETAQYLDAYFVVVIYCISDALSQYIYCSI